VGPGGWFHPEDPNDTTIYEFIDPSKEDENKSDEEASDEEDEEDGEEDGDEDGDDEDEDGDGDDGDEDEDDDDEDDDSFDLIANLNEFYKLARKLNLSAYAILRHKEAFKEANLRDAPLARLENLLRRLSNHLNEMNFLTDLWDI
ncbi:MAG: hypothetical protein AB1921_15420, partial [Thermodesulfobacteriota bacterium]